MPLNLSSLIKKPERPLSSNEDAPAPGVDPKMQMESFLNSIAEYKSLGGKLKQATTMSEIGQKLAAIASMAEQALVAEAGDWYDAHTLKRNMKEVTAYTGDFNKLATEADMINQRMHALYEDMGRVLERYFELPEEQIDAGTPPEAQSAPAPIKEQPAHANGRFFTKEELLEFGKRAKQIGEKAVTPPVHLEEDALEKEAPESPARPVKEPVTTSDPGAGEMVHDELDDVPMPNMDALSDTPEPVVDELTLRAIKAVYDNLKRTNPEYASRFKALPAKKMVDAVWRLVR